MNFVSSSLYSVIISMQLKSSFEKSKYFFPYTEQAYPSLSYNSISNNSRGKNRKWKGPLTDVS